MHNNDFVNEICSEFGACPPRPGDTECRSSVSCAAQGQRACPEGMHAMLPRRYVQCCFSGEVL